MTAFLPSPSPLMPVPPVSPGRASRRLRTHNLPKHHLLSRRQSAVRRIPPTYVRQPSAGQQTALLSVTLTDPTPVDTATGVVYTPFGQHLRFHNGLRNRVRPAIPSGPEHTADVSPLLPCSSTNEFRDERRVGGKIFEIDLKRERNVVSLRLFRNHQV